MKSFNTILRAIIASLLLAALPAASRAAPGALSSTVPERVFIDSADYLKTEEERSITTLRGDVKIHFGDVRVWADEATIDDRSKTVVAKGNVTVVDRESTMSCDLLVYKFNEKYFEMMNVSGHVKTQETQDEVYFRGEIVKGTERKIKVLRADFTTCGPHCPGEYHMLAANASIYPGNKIIARKVAVYLRNTRVMFLPLYLISLKNKENYQPEFGYDKIRGFYVLSKYPYLGREFISGWIILDYMTKKGIKYGADHKYKNVKLGGDGRVYFETNNAKDTGNSNNRINVTQQLIFGKRISGNLSYNRNNSYNIYYPDSRTNTTNVGVNLNYKQTGYKTIGVRYTSADSRSRSENENKTITVTRKTRLSKNLTVDYVYSQSAQKSGASPKNEEARFSSKIRYSIPRIMTIDALTYKTFDPDGDDYPNDGRVSVNNQKLPEIKATLKPNLWQGFLSKSLIPLKTVTFQHGRYRQGNREDSEALRRNSIEMMASKPFKFGNRLSVTPRQTFKQRFYSTKDATYVMDHSTDLRYQVRRPGKTTAFNLKYRKAGDSGGTPYPGDRGAEQILLSGGLTLTKARTKFSVVTSYNYKNFSYSPLSINYNRAISQNAILDVTGSRNLNRHLWSDTKTNLLIRRKNTKLNVAATWDTEDDFDLKTMNLNTVHKRRNGWEITIRSVYEHRSQYEIIRDVIATKTRCCTKLQFAYYTQRDEFRFQYLILAFPSKSFGFTQGEQGFKLDENLMEIKSEEQKK